MKTWQDVGIDESRLGPGNVKMPCPKCGPTRNHPNDPSLSVNRDEATWKCHNCEWVGSLKSRDHFQASKEYAKREWKRPSESTYLGTVSGGLPVDVIDYFAKRGISEHTLKDNDVGFGPGAQFGFFRVLRPEETDYVKGQDKKKWETMRDKRGVPVSAIYFPYRMDGELINVKSRLWSDGTAQKDFRLTKDAQKIFWQIDRVSETTIIVEGEIDLLTLYECGYYNVVSVPNGASVSEYLEACADQLKAVQRFVLMVDGDAAGDKLRDELARRLGKENCLLVDYPPDTKDINEVLLTYGRDEVDRVVRSARYLPIEGLVEMADLSDEIAYYYEYGMPQGLSSGFPSLDPLFRIGGGSFVIVTGKPGHGKALALDTKVPTPTGWTTMGELRVGDRILDDQGDPCTVIAATEVMHDRPCFDVRFSDGSSIIADSEHQWMTRDEKARQSIQQARIKRGDRVDVKPRGTDQSHLRTHPSVKTTRQIAESVRVRGRLNHHVAVARSLNLPRRDLALPPYVLGAWLGDGTSSSAQITTADPEILATLARLGFPSTKQASPYRYGIAGLLPHLRTLDVLNNKHIPTAYLRGSRSQRSALLQGLMDTDGSVTPYGRCEFTNTNERLARGVYELVASLGWIPRWTLGRATLNGKDCGEKYRVMFTPHGRVFGLERKQRHIKQEPRVRLAHRAIVSCDPVASVPVRCIQVDSPSSLFLAGEAMIPTHNSTWVAQMLVNMADLHDLQIGVFSPEDSPTSSFAIKLLSKRIGKPFEPSKRDRMTPEEMVAGLSWIQDHFVSIAPSEMTFSIDEILRLARVAVYRRGIKILVIDPWNEIDHNRPRNMTEGEYISQTLSKLRIFARMNDCAVILVAHPRKTERVKTKDGETVEAVPDLEDVAGSFHFRAKADMGVTVWRDITKTDGDQAFKIYVTKVRQPWNGRIGMIELNYDVPTGRIVDQMGGPKPLVPSTELDAVFDGSL